jgi:hypothetical protein
VPLTARLTRAISFALPAQLIPVLDIRCVRREFCGWSECSCNVRRRDLVERGFGGSGDATN